jgi:hypothetical protein
LTEPAGAVPPAPQRRVSMWIWGAAGAAAVLIYGLLIERMRLGPPLVMLALGGMTLAFTAGAIWKMIDPLARVEPPGTGAVASRGRGFVREVEREKQLVLKAIKEIELDYQMRKIAERDYREMIERYRNRAMRLISELEAGGDFRGLIEKELKLRLELPAAPSLGAAVPPAAARPVCPGCKTSNEPDAKICKSCAAKLS